MAGTGTVNLNHGHNSVKVTCTAQNGAAREYVIDIVRQGSAQYAKGDVNGDGGITLLDMLLDCLKVKRHILGYEYIR